MVETGAAAILEIIAINQIQLWHVICKSYIQLLEFDLAWDSPVRSVRANRNTTA